jgi:hypothetical protein
MRRHGGDRPVPAVCPVLVIERPPAESRGPAEARAPSTRSLSLSPVPADRRETSQTRSDTVHPDGRPLGWRSPACYIHRRELFRKNAFAADLTPIERAYIRSQLDRFFSTFPTVAQGLQLKMWRVVLRRTSRNCRPPRLFFTETSLTTLRAMMANGRLADPVKFAHVRRELGIDPISARQGEADDSDVRFAAGQGRSDQGERTGERRSRRVRT